MQFKYDKKFYLITPPLSWFGKHNNTATNQADKVNLCNNTCCQIGTQTARTSGAKKDSLI